MQWNDKKELIAELYYLSLDKSVDCKKIYYMMEAIMEMFGNLNRNQGTKESDWYDD